MFPLEFVVTSLFYKRDEKCANIFEALVGTLRAAKKRKIVKFEGEMLLSPMNDNTDIVLL